MAENAVMEQNAFEGVRVVELAQWVFVPVAGALLADWGADVIHIEPLQGDPYRGLMTQGIGAGKDGVNLSMALANRGKRSLASWRFRWCQFTWLVSTRSSPKAGSPSTRSSPRRHSPSPTETRSRLCRR